MLILKVFSSILFILFCLNAHIIINFRTNFQAKNRFTTSTLLVFLSTLGNIRWETNHSRRAPVSLKVSFRDLLLLSNWKSKRERERERKSERKVVCSSILYAILVCCWNWRIVYRLHDERETLIYVYGYVYYIDAVFGEVVGHLLGGQSFNHGITTNLYVMIR